MTLYGCHNRAEPPALVKVQHGWCEQPVNFHGQPTRLPRMTFVPYRMSRECKHTGYHPNDPQCEGCREQRTLGKPK